MNFVYSRQTEEKRVLGIKVQRKNARSSRVRENFHVCNSVESGKGECEAKKEENTLFLLYTIREICARSNFTIAIVRIEKNENFARS